MTLTKFESKVFRALRRIPPGRVTTYGQIAKYLDKPKAARAVGNACHNNPFAPRVPCHRVVRNHGGIGGYAEGIKKKIALLKRELIKVKNGKIMDFKKKLFKMK